MQGAETPDSPLANDYRGNNRHNKRDSRHHLLALKRGSTPGIANVSIQGTITRPLRIAH